jgi:probable F420-dependent oxidoreductase
MTDAVRPFRFGLSVWGATSRDEWRNKARRAETAGFDTLLIGDHLVDGMFSSLSALVAAAEATERIRVGTLVTNNDFRHPVVLARDAAVVDLLTDGRLELGLGAGHMKHEYDGAGLQFDPPKVRVARMAEAATIIRGLLGGDEVTFHGEHYRVDAQRCYPVPEQRVPLLIGGNGRGVLRTAARLADIVGFTGFSQVEGQPAVNPTHFTDEGLSEQIAWVRSAAPDRFDQLELTTLVQGITITNDRRGAAAELQPLLPALTVDDVLSSPYGLIGTAEQIADQLRARRERLGISYLTVFEKDLDAMAEVIELVRAAGVSRTSGRRTARR